MSKASKAYVSRRTFLGALAATAVAAKIRPTKRPRNGAPASVAVVGAGAFGGFTALELLRRGCRVTLIDAWGPGNSRASSGGETRVIRGVYGSDRIYTEMAARAFRLWRENEARWKRTLYRRTGALWMLGDEGQFVRDSMPILRDNGFPYEELTSAEAARRYPQVSFDGIRWALLEKEAGYLLARQACARVLEGFVAEGGSYRQAAVSAPEPRSGRLSEIRLSGGAAISADAYVFACGPWLPKLLPGAPLEPGRADPPGGLFLRRSARRLSFRRRSFPGVGRGAAVLLRNSRKRTPRIQDRRRRAGRAFRPDRPANAIPSAEGLRSARDYVARRFPALAKAPWSRRACASTRTRPTTTS